MWSDILTKPLQGAKFYEMRAELMNSPIGYHEQSAETMHAIMEDLKPVFYYRGVFRKMCNII